VKVVESWMKAEWNGGLTGCCLDFHPISIS
jgi:hypothetical protein